MGVFRTRGGGVAAGRSVSRIVVLLAALVARASSAEETPAAADVIRKLNDTFQSVLKDAQKLGYDGRLARLTPVIDSTFDLEFMARTAIGAEWSNLGEAERKRWLEAFGNLTKANYAGRFDHWSNQSFEFLGEEPSANDTVMIRTRVIDPGSENVDISYRMRKTDAGWKVIDIYLKGTVSALALRRSEYSAVLKREGFEALVASVEKKIGDLRAGKADATVSR